MKKIIVCSMICLGIMSAYAPVRAAVATGTTVYYLEQIESVDTDNFLLLTYNERIVRLLSSTLSSATIRNRQGERLSISKLKEGQWIAVKGKEADFDEDRNMKAVTAESIIVLPNKISMEELKKLFQ